MKVFYHNDMDGHCAAAVVAKYFNNYDRKDYIESDYMTKPDISLVDDRDIVYFVDYSFTDKTIDVLYTLLKEKKCRVVWIDHHKSSLNCLEQHSDLEQFVNFKYFLDDKMCGAYLTWLYHYMCEVPDAIKLVDDYDRWQFNLPDTKRFKLGVDANNNDFDSVMWTKLLNYDDTELNRVINAGTPVFDYIENNNTYYLNSFGFETEITGIKCIAVNYKTNSWIFGDNYYKYPLCCVFAFNGKKWSYSIYSNCDDIDCSKIAESFGGGGHKGAAGFSTDKLIFTED